MAPAEADVDERRIRVAVVPAREVEPVRAAPRVDDLADVAVEARPHRGERLAADAVEDTSECPSGGASSTST